MFNKEEKKDYKALYENQLQVNKKLNSELNKYKKQNEIIYDEDKLIDLRLFFKQNIEDKTTYRYISVVANLCKDNKSTHLFRFLDWLNKRIEKQKKEQ